MKRIMHISAFSFALLTLSFYVLNYFYSNTVCFSLYVTFLTFTYHFFMRLFVGFFTRFLLERICNCESFWFRPKKAEKKIYSFLKVKKWKKFIPTYDTEAFSVEKRSFEEILLSMCIAEITHEIIVLFSFVPILFSLSFGVPAVFIITSFAAAGVDMIFVIVQRYNRPRVLRLIKLTKNKIENHIKI